MICFPSPGGARLLGRWRVYISSTGMFYVSVNHTVCIFFPTSKFHRALARPKGWECVYHCCPTWTCQASLLRPARIWMV